MDCFAIEVKLTTGKNVIINTKWEKSEVEIEIFHENSELMLKGRKNMSEVEKQCKILSFELSDVKKSLNSFDPLIQFEINDSQKTLTILKNEFLSQDSENEIKIKMFSVDLIADKFDTYNVIKQFASINHDLQKQVEEQNKLLKQVEESVITTSTRLSAISSSHIAFKANAYRKFVTLLNTKKLKIEELTRQLERETIKALGSANDISNYVLNTSSGSEMEKSIVLQPRRQLTPKRKRTPIKPKVSSPFMKKESYSRKILLPKEDLLKLSTKILSPKKHSTPSNSTPSFKSLFQFKRIPKENKFDPDSPPKLTSNLPKPFFNNDALNCEAGTSKQIVRNNSSDSSFSFIHRAASVCSVRSGVAESAQVMEIDSSLDHMHYLEKYHIEWTSDSSTDIEKKSRKLRSSNTQNGLKVKPAGSEDLFTIDEVVPNSQEHIQPKFEASYSKRRNSLKYQSPRSAKKPKNINVSNYEVDTIPIMK